MAREEHDREDLWAEARALVVRAEVTQSPILQLSEDDPFVGLVPIVFGFRADDSASFYFGHDCVYHFNAEGELRRAYLAGRLIKSEQGRLAALARRRDGQESSLLRSDLSAQECADVINSLQTRLRRLGPALEVGSLNIGRAMPDALMCRRRLLAWLTRLPDRIAIANQPGLRR